MRSLILFISLIASINAATIIVECKPTNLQKFNDTWEFELNSDYVDENGYKVKYIAIDKNKNAILISDLYYVNNILENIVLSLYNEANDSYYNLKPIHKNSCNVRIIFGPWKNIK